MRITFAKRIEPFDCQFQASDGCVGPHVGQPRTLDQGHLAERHARHEAGETRAVAQLDADHPALQEEHRGGGVAGGNDALAGLEDARRCQLGQLVKFARRETRQQGLLREIGAIGQIAEASVAVDHLVLGPFDRLVERGKPTDLLGALHVALDDERER